MDFITSVFSKGNYLAALAATASTFVVGFLWYHPKTFGKAWMAGVGISEADARASNMVATFGANALAAFLASLALTVTLVPAQADWIAGLKGGAFVGIFWSATTHVMHSAFQLHSGKTIAIGVGHDVLHFAMIGLILGLF